MAKQFRVIFHFTDGSKLDAEVDAQTQDPAKAVQNIRKAMDADKIMIEIEGQLFLIPLNNVKYMQISPSPDKLPDGVIKGARLVS
jgi:hypothetical protein